MGLVQAGYSPWDNPFLPALQPPLTPVTPYRQDSLGHWSGGYRTMSTQLPPHMAADEVFTTPYSMYQQPNLRSQAYQVPLTPITPAALDPYSNYCSMSPFNATSLANQSVHSGTVFSSGMDHRNYQSL